MSLKGLIDKDYARKILNERKLRRELFKDVKKDRFSKNFKKLKKKLKKTRFSGKRYLKAVGMDKI